MRSKAGMIACVAGAALLFGCHKAPVPSVNESMTEVMEPSAETIWNITSKAYNDVGDGFVASKISAADWDQIQKAAQQLKDRAELLGNARQITVAKPGEKIMGEQAAGTKGPIGPDWDAVNAQQVQAKIDGDRALFTKRAQALAEAGASLVQAATSKDVHLLYKVSSELDEVCDACHEPFWGTDVPPPVKP